MHHEIQIGGNVLASVLALVFYFVSHRQQGERSGYGGFLLAMSIAYGLMALGIDLDDTNSKYAGIGHVFGALGVIVFGFRALSLAAQVRKGQLTAPKLAVNHPAPAQEARVYKELRVYNDWARPDPE